VSRYSPILGTLKFNPGKMNLTIAPVRGLNPGLPLSNLPGIGRHTPRALAHYGVNTIGQFALFTENEIISLLGKSGKKLLKVAKQITRKNR